MLRIEKVFLQGFKSFNDPTELLFDPKGITAVVGPNGCGKSNVADALSWVIGEQRAKALRGGKMEDVIFQGSRNRKPSGMAEVILTMQVYESFELRVQDKEPPPPFNASLESPAIAGQDIAISTEPTSTASSSKAPTRIFQEGERVTVARRLYRTGDSEYEMNGKICRLRDIQDLFTGTGLGGAHYAIIEQGRIGQVLSAKPLDRRALIEEAAGISKFKMRQRSSELKLEAARQNLSRVTDIITEVERQQNSLKRQAAKSRRYQRLRNEMRDLMRAVYIVDYKKTNESIIRSTEDKQSIHLTEATFLSKIEETELARQSAFTEVEKQGQILTQTREETSQCQLLLEKARQQHRHINEQINSLDLRSQQFSRDQVTIGERERLISQEIIRLRETLIKVEAEITIEANSLSEAEALFSEQALQDNLIEKDLEVAQKRLTESATHRERWKQLVHQFTDAVERATRTLAGLKTELQRTHEQADKINLEWVEISEKLQDQEIEQERRSVQHSRLLDQYHQNKTTCSLLESKHKQLEQQITATDQRLKSLLELDEKRAYFSQPVQAIIQASKKSLSPFKFKIVNTLADFIKVPSQYETLVEVVLKDELQYLISPDFDNALQAIDFLKSENLGRATFLVLNSKQVGTASPADLANATIVTLIDLLGMKPDLKLLIQQALPKLSQTVIAHEIEQAIQDSVSTNGKGPSFLTAQGEFVSAGHVITGGSFIEQGTGILALKREIESLQLSLVELQASEDSLMQELNLVRIDLQNLSEESASIEGQIREVEKTIVLNQGIKQQVGREKERTTTHLRVVEKEMEVAQLDLNQASEKLTHAQTELQSAEEALIATEQITSDLQANILEIRQAASFRSQDISRRRADFAAKSERRKGLQQDIKRLENEEQDIKQRLALSQFEAIETEEKVSALQNTLTHLNQEIENLQQNYQASSDQLEQLNSESLAVKETLQTFEVELRSLREAVDRLREQRTQIEVVIAKLTATLEHIEVACLADLSEPISELVAKFEQIGFDENQKEIQHRTPSIVAASSEPGDEDDDPESEIESSFNFHQLLIDFDLVTGKARLQDLRQKVEALGPVNLLALEELGELEERLNFLQEQKTDIEQAVTDTVAVIAELKRRSRDRFVEAFHQINQNFTEMFTELFGGGHGEMRLIDETDVLESGIDIIAQPPGKRLQNVLLLSGGEKAMAAMALIMGIFKYRPSPFCLLDEVDAPLDDVNIGRFADKILEMSDRTQFLVITHSKRTMEAAKTMYGVTMEDPGVSKLISVRLS